MLCCVAIAQLILCHTKSIAEELRNEFSAAVRLDCTKSAPIGLTFTPFWNWTAVGFGRRCDFTQRFFSEQMEFKAGESSSLKLSGSTEREISSKKNKKKSFNCFHSALYVFITPWSVFHLNKMTRKHCSRIDTIPSPVDNVAVVRTRINHFIK